MAARAAALACFLATAAAAPQLADKLYACQDQQCVLSARGLPLSECEAGCVPRPNANYTCSGGQCVTSARGLPKAKCTQVCGGPGPGGKTIVDLAVADPDLSTLVTALKAGGLVGTLSGQGPFTVFAPTNEAFASLPAGVVANLLKPENKAQLVDVLTYHVVAGAVRAEDLKDGEKLKTVEGKELTVRISGSTVFINSAKVTTADVTASNGVVHIIDEVLLPAGPAPPPGPGPPPPPPPPPGPAPKGCTKAGCYFSFTWQKPAFGIAKFGGRCGEVDAAPRMPDDIWNDTKAVANYVSATCADFGNDIIGAGVLTQEPCAPVGNTFPRPNRAWSRNGTKQIDWLGDPARLGGEGFVGFCRKRCGCSVIGALKPDKPPCTDQPDTPPSYCSLCGPTLNAPIDVQLWYPTGAPPPPPACTPGGTPPACNIVALAETAPTLKTLVTAVVAGNLSNTLSSRGPFTVFAPDDKAFAAIDPNVLASLLRPENIGELDALLELHVVSGDIRAKDIKDDQKIKTLAGGELTFSVSGGSPPTIFVYSKGTTAAQIIAADNIATNGVVHIIKKVLEPQ